MHLSALTSSSELQPEAFLRTIYLGDRARKGLLIDCWGKKLKVHVDVISRIRDDSGEWKYYDAEDIEGRFFVLDDLRAIRFDPAGSLPNDYIHGVVVRPVDGGDEALY